MTAKHIILVIRMISFGNLCGNTWEAVISRLKGDPVPSSNILFSVYFFNHGSSNAYNQKR